MKKLLIAGVALTALIGTPVLAADMALKAPPPPAPVFSWSGCYLGVNAGLGWGRDTNGFGTAVISGATEGGGLEFPPEAGPYNHSTSGGVAGGQVGCNYQTQSNWVVGVEGEVFWSGIKGSLQTAEDASDPGSFTRFTSQNRSDADIALRLGYAWGRNLLYGKVGGAWGNFRYGEWHDDFGSDNNPACTPACNVNINQTRSGLLLGAGWEYAFQNNWSFKVEYNYIDFGSATIAYPAPSASMQSFSVRDINQIVKAGVNFKFY
jgi:outer membrane immunogenic protein